MYAGACQHPRTSLASREVRSPFAILHAMPDFIELLRPIAIFQNLDDGELAQFAEICRIQEYQSGEVIFREGEAGNRLYLIVAGEVRISRDIPGSGEEALAVLKAGTLFGEMAVFDHSERSTDAFSHGGTQVLTISRTEFDMVLDFDRDIAHKVLRAVVQLLSSRLRSTNDSLRSFLAMSIF